MNIFRILLLLLCGNALSAQTKIIGYSYAGQDSQPNSGGCIFAINQDGTDFLTLRNFEKQDLGLSFPKGASPGKVFLGSDGFLYGGMNLADAFTGTYLFKMKPDGSEFQSIFEGIGEMRSFFEGPDGYLYGASRGFIFKLKKDGSEFSKLTEYEDIIFTVMGDNGKLYWLEGNSIYWMNSDGSGKEPFYTFQSNLDIQYGLLHKTPNGSLLLYYLVGWPNPMNPSSTLWNYSVLHLSESGEVLHELAYPNGSLPASAIRSDDFVVFDSNGRIHFPTNSLNQNFWPSTCGIAKISPDFLSSNGKIYGGSIDSLYQPAGIYSFDPATNQCEEIVPATLTQLGIGSRIACEIIDSTSGVLTPANIFQALKIYPNPVGNSTDNLAILFKEVAHEAVSVVLTDFTGQYILQKTAIFSENMNIDISPLKAGIYMLQIWQSGEMIGVAKVLRI